MNPASDQAQLIDGFNRRVSYVRISVTDRCDFRCVYCMAEDMQFVPRAQLLTLEEIISIGSRFVDLGIDKIRITGGEPLTRRNVLKVFQELGSRDGLRELTLTTNGSRLREFATPLFSAGVRRVNVSLDSLDANRFRELTRVGDLNKVLAGLKAAQDAGLHVKLNSVVMKNRNEDETSALVGFAIENGFDISFIEEMPLGLTDDHDRAEAFYSSDEIRADLSEHHMLVASAESTGGPSRYFNIVGSESKVGFISPHTHNFCDTCNRVRLTAEGRLLLCLGQEHSVDLRAVVRQHPNDPLQLERAIIDSMTIKPQGHEFDRNQQTVIVRLMSLTGG